MRKSSRSKYRFAPFVFLAAVFICAALPSNAQTNLLSRKMVWAHEMTCFPMTLFKTGGTAYGPLYPLDLAYFNRTAKSDAYPNIQDAIAAGLDGFDVNIFTAPASITGYLNAADSIDASLPANQPPFLIAPCLDLGILRNQGMSNSAIDSVVISTVEQYCVLALSHPSAARQGESFVIFNYSTASLTEPDWIYVRTQLANAGYPTYWVANVGAWNISSQGTFPSMAVSQYFPAFESGFLFGESGQWWSDLLSLYAGDHIPFAGGMTPGYNHEGEGYLDASGTSVYRLWWDAHISAKPPWIHIATWNDMSEETDILPTSNWSTTRSDITAFNAAVYRGDPPPFADPRLYITTPQGLAVAQSAVAEALVLNPTSNRCFVSIQLFDGNGKPYGAAAAQTLLPGEGYVDTPVNPSTAPAGGYLVARASLSVNGQPIAQVISAPIIVYPTTTGFNQTYAGNRPRIRYYSIPAVSALPGKIKLSIVPLAGGLTALATITPPSGTTLRFVDLLHNTREVYNFANAGPFAITVPTGKVILGSGVTLPDTSVAGFYVARVIDSSGRVGYSDPVYVP